MEPPLYRALVNEMAEDRCYALDDLESQPDDGLMEVLPTGDRMLRGQVRLLIKSMVDIARADHKNHEYVPLLRGVPWCSSRVLATRATTRFLKIAEWSSKRDGEHAGSSWVSAAQIASWLMEDYNGYPHSVSYADLSGWYVSALPSVGWNEQLVRDLLKSLKSKETS